MTSVSRPRRLAIFSLSVVGLAGATAVSTSDVAMSAARAVLADPLTVLAGRSPGERGNAQLSQTKPERVAALERPPVPGAGNPFVPTERVLPIERVRPGLPVIDGLAPPAGFAGTPLLVPPGGGGVLDGGAPGIVGPQGSGGFLPSPGIPGGGGGGGGGGVLVPGTDLPGGAVPEPATWVTLIGGTLAVGAALRRRRRRGVDAVAHADARP